MALLSILSTTWQGLQSKAVMYGLSALGISLVIWRVISSLVIKGRNEEKLRQLEAQVKARKQNEQIQARNAGTSTAALRERMRNDWSRNDK